MSKLRLGAGVYSVPEAARLARVHPKSIRRWYQGYSYHSRGEERSLPALWRPDFPEIDGKLALSFRDLIEVLFVDAFRSQGVGWKEIRAAATKAAKDVRDSHPFSTRKFKTDGKRILEETGEEVGSKRLLEIVSGQHAIEEVVGPKLYEGLRFEAGEGTVSRWYPLEGSEIVVLNPEVQFGRPIVEPFGVRTEILARAVKANESVDQVADWFEVSRDAVEAAIRYEKHLAA